MTRQGSSFTEWCVWWGGEDPNNCAGLLVYDDQEDAEEHMQWFAGSRAACRTVTRGPWYTNEAALLAAASEQATP